MSSEQTPHVNFAAAPSLRYQGPDAERYISMLTRALRSARLNTFFTDSRALISHVEPLAPSITSDLYEGVEVNLHSGLPTYREWTRVQTDVQIAAEQLAQLGPRAPLATRAASARDPIFAKQLAKHDYYTKLRGRALAPLGAMTVSLRRVDAAQRRAWFHVVLDKLDVSGVFVRYAIDLSQQSGVWNEQVVRLDAEHARHTQGFQDLIYQFTSLGSVFTWAKLTSIQGLELERISRGVVGPIYLSPEYAPEPLQAVWDGVQVEHGFIATFGQDIISNDIAEARDNDPLTGLLPDPVPADARATFNAVRANAGVNHYLERKFVVPRAMVPNMNAFCMSRGTRNIVYGI
jgi:hypothetical protein